MPDSTPRDITPFIRRRAWGDPRVRAWWLLAVVLLVLAAYLAIQQYIAWSRLNRAIMSGVFVQAKIEAVDDDPRIGKNVSPGAISIIQYDYEGKHYRMQGMLAGLKKFSGNVAVAVGDIIPIHIEPANPENWAARDDVPSLSAAMVGAILVLPVALFAGGVAVIARAKVLRTYQYGAAVEAIVSANKQTPLAPRSRAILCAIIAGGRVIEIFVPQSMATLAAGDAVQVILPPRGGRPLAAAWFEEA